jgi:hypothetical protein
VSVTNQAPTNAEYDRAVPSEVSFVRKLAGSLSHWQSVWYAPTVTGNFGFWVVPATKADPCASTAIASPEVVMTAVRLAVID